MAPQVGLEPTTLRLTAGCSAIELLRSEQLALRRRSSRLNVFLKYHASQTDSNSQIDPQEPGRRTHFELRPRQKGAEEAAPSFSFTLLPNQTNLSAESSKLCSAAAPTGSQGGVPRRNRLLSYL